jgi:hypothetical protein
MKSFGEFCSHLIPSLNFKYKYKNVKPKETFLFLLAGKKEKLKQIASII